MSDAKKPGGLLSQYNLLGAIIDAPWATRLDIKVARHVIDRYYPKHGNGRASLRYLERATGALRPSIIASLRRLADNGAISMVRQGQGTRPTEYALNFDFPASGIVDDTSSDDSPSGIVGNTAGGIVGDTSTASSGIAGDTESYLQNPAYKAEILIDRNDTAPAPPPDGAGPLGAAPPEAPVEGAATFESVWRAYGYAKGKKEARAAWKALPPDTNLAAVIEAAKAWQESWAAQGKPDAPRFTLARWLKDERFDEDAPRGFQKVERAKSTSKATPAKTKPATRTTARVTAADVVETGDVTELRFTATDAQGVEHERIVVVQHYDAETQFAGQRQLTALVHAAGLSEIEDSAELLGRTIILTGDEDEFSAPTTRPDDEPPLPIRPEPVRYANPTPVAKSDGSPRDFATRMAKSINSGDWPAWMDDAA